VDLLQGVSESLEIGRVSGVTDIEIARDHRRSPEASRDPTDHDEVDSVLDQDLQCRDRIE
jgi:hypothetical protein